MAGSRTDQSVARNPWKEASPPRDAVTAARDKTFVRDRVVRALAVCRERMNIRSIGAPTDPVIRDVAALALEGRNRHRGPPLLVARCTP
jgi:hypothetical protein